MKKKKMKKKSFRLFKNIQKFAVKRSNCMMNLKFYKTFKSHKIKDFKIKHALQKKKICLRASKLSFKNLKFISFEIKSLPHFI